MLSTLVSRQELLKIKSFLYRRFARFIACTLAFEGGGSLALESKYEVASFQDVFCNAFYWNVVGCVQSPYDFVVDCGANCGHFSLLVDACIRARWGFSAARYIAVEPNPNLLPVIRKNAQDAGIAGRLQVHHGLLGVAGESGILWVHNRSYLGASAWPRQGSRAYRVPVLDLERLLGSEPVGILKVDIEGTEYELLPSVAAVLRRTKTLFLEIHRHPTSAELSQLTLMKSLCESGFSIEAEYRRAGNLLVIARRSSIGAPDFVAATMDSVGT